MAGTEHDLLKQATQAMMARYGRGNALFFTFDANARTAALSFAPSRSDNIDATNERGANDVLFVYPLAFCYPMSLAHALTSELTRGSRKYSGRFSYRCGNQKRDAL